MMKNNLVRLLLLSLCLLNLGCSAAEWMRVKGQPLEKPTERPAEGDVRVPAAKALEPPAGEELKAPSGHEVLKPPIFERPSGEKVLPPDRPIDQRRVALTKEPVMINVEKMPLSDFIIYALGETLKVSFVMDQKVMDNKEPVTLRMADTMPSDKAFEIILGLLDKYNLHVEEKAGALYILHKSPEPKRPFDIKIGREIPEGPAQILQVVPLRYVKPPEIEALLRELYKTAVMTRSHIRENVLLLYGQASQIKQMMEFIETFDLPYFQEKKLGLFRLTYWQIDDFIKQVTQILEGMGIGIAKTSRDPGVLFIPIKPIGSILAIAPDETALNYVLHWKDKLDTPEAAGAEEKPFVFNPRYSKASDLVQSIKNLYGIMPAPPRVPAAPFTPATPASSPAPSAPARPPAPTPAGPLKISSDDLKNIIMVVSTPAEYRSILSLLKELDSPPRQVLIEATVAELTLRDDLKFGLEWFIRDRMFSGGYTLQTLFSVPRGGPGLVYQFISDSEKFSALINAFALDDRVNILSKPRLMVLDNQEAIIQVGTDIPVVTGEVTAQDVTQAQPSILRNIQYRNTGVILRVKPTINTEGLLTLNISQEVSEMGSNPPGINSPTILMRRTSTTVVASQGETIVIGGLIAESKGTIINKIPFLGDIPLIGHLFKTTSKLDRKTELIIFLKPVIISSIDQASKITDDLKKELKWLK